MTETDKKTVRGWLPITKAIKHMLYCRFLTCVLLNFGSNVEQRCRYLHAYVL